jgi:polysaccharide transporter, PST family
MSAPLNPISDDPFGVALDAEGLKTRSMHGSFVTGVSQGTKIATQLGSQVILARLLLPSDFGLLAMVSPVIGFILVFNDIGFGQTLVQRPKLLRDQVSALFWVNLALSCVLVCVVVLASPLVGWAYGEPRVVSVMIVLGILIPISALSINPTALLLRQMRFSWLACKEVAATLAGVVITVFCAWIGWSYWSLVAGQLAYTLVDNMIAWAVCGWFPSRPKFVGSAWADLKFGGNLTGANLATYITTSGDNIIVGLMTGAVSLGLYDRSYRLVVQPLGQMLAPISRIALPLLSRLGDRPDAYRRAYLKIIRMLLLLTLPGMLVCITHGEVIIRVFLGPRWSEAAPIFSWVCVGGLAAGINSSAYWLFVSQGRARALRHFTIGASFINVVSFVLGAFFWGIVGVAAVGATTYVVVTTPFVLYGATLSGPVHFRDLICCAASFALRGTITCAMLIVVERYLTADDLGQIVFVTLLSYGFFFGLSVLNSDERELIRYVARVLPTLFGR